MNDKTIELKQTTVSVFVLITVALFCISGTVGVMGWIENKDRNLAKSFNEKIADFSNKLDSTNNKITVFSDKLDSTNNKMDALQAEFDLLKTQTADRIYKTEFKLWIYKARESGYTNMPMLNK